MRDADVYLFGPMNLLMLPQPDDTTCGPTSLQAVYRYLGLELGLDEVIGAVDVLEEGGTLAVYLGLDALRRGFQAELVSYDLHAFDPSWNGLPPDALVERLEAQLRYKHGKKFTESTRAYQAFLRGGGRLRFDDLTTTLLHRYFDRGLPILTGLSATYLYGTRREYTDRRGRLVHDDLKGVPTGHFVVLGGFEDGEVVVADPYQWNPIAQDHYYRVDARRLLNAILLGTVTYDANLLVLAPPESSCAS